MQGADLTLHELVPLQGWNERGSTNPHNPRLSSAIVFGHIISSTPTIHKTRLRSFLHFCKSLCCKMNFFSLLTKQTSKMWSHDEHFSPIADSLTQQKHGWHLQNVHHFHTSDYIHLSGSLTQMIQLSDLKCRLIRYEENSYNWHCRTNFKFFTIYQMIVKQHYACKEPFLRKITDQQQKNRR